MEEDLTDCTTSARRRCTEQEGAARIRLRGAVTLLLREVSGQIRKSWARFLLDLLCFFFISFPFSEPDLLAQFYRIIMRGFYFSPE